MQPETRYAKSGDVHIAYQVVGEGNIDLVLVPGWVSHLEIDWDDPVLGRSYTRLASFTRLIRFDKRGTGLSDRVPNAALPSLEQRMDDVRAVMDRVGSERAVLFGVSEGGPMSLLFAATYPERVSALVLYGSYARRTWAPDYPVGLTAETQEQFARDVEENWGSETLDLKMRAPEAMRDERSRARSVERQRQAASPGAALALLRMNFEIDVRHVLSAIRVPTLILHFAGDQRVDVRNGRYLAEHLPAAKYVELPGGSHVPTVDGADRLVDEVEEFVTGERQAVEPNRVLATVLFTDIVGSTQHLARLGDRRWQDLLDDHFRAARREITRHRGREVKTTGDGLLATFDGPARAIRCARAIQSGTSHLGIAIRAGLHAGEVEVLVVKRHEEVPV